MQTRQVKEQEWIYREGDPARLCYIVQSGKVRLSQAGSEDAVAMVRPGECFGEIALLDETAHFGTGAQAIEPTVLQIMTMDEFHDHIHQCPPVLLPLLELAFEQLKRTSLRATTATVAEVKIEGIHKVTIRSGSEALQTLLPHPVEIMMSRLPYKIGGYPENGDIHASDNNNLFLPCKSPPLAISRQHCQIDAQDDHLILLDLGSRFNTIVGEVAIGRGRGNYKARLAPGDNPIRLGWYDSPYLLIVHIE